MDGGIAMNEVLQNPFELTRLLEPLARSEAPELDASDERLLAPDAYADKGDFASAARAAEQLLAAGVYDVRPLPYALYQAFVQGGYPALLTVFHITLNLVGPSREALTPTRRLDDYLNRRWHWLFDKVDSALVFQQKADGAAWARFLEGADSALLDDLLQAGARLGEALAAPAFHQVAGALGRLLARIREQNLTRREPEPDSAGVRDAPPSALVNAPEPTPSLSRSSLREDGAERMELVVSPQFKRLLRSLEAFEILVQKQQFLKAAVVLADISESVEHFDPRRHFPAVFASFASLYSKHVDALTSNRSESPAWLALRQHYQVDLQGFVES
jgi:hypothetical protein